MSGILQILLENWVVKIFCHEKRKIHIVMSYKKTIKQTLALESLWRFKQLRQRS